MADCQSQGNVRGSRRIGCIPSDMHILARGDVPTTSAGYDQPTRPRLDKQERIVNREG